jgi:hypothetical protein
VRRALGYRLARAEKLLAQFLAFVEHRGEEHLTIESDGASRRRSELDVQASLRPCSTSGCSPVLNTINSASL